MNIHHVLFLYFLSGALSAVPIFTKTEGETLSFGCSFNSRQGSKFFTKKGSKNENVLIETTNVTAQSGRYGIKYDADVNIFYVSISQLNKSDSGWYRCGLGKSSSFSKSHREFEVRVTDAMCDGNTTLADPGITVCSETEGGSIRVRCSFSSAGLFNLFFCKNRCKKQDVLIETDGFRAQRGRYRIEYAGKGEFSVTIANVTRSDSGLFRCGVNVLSAPNPCQTFELRVTDAPTTSKPNSTLLPFISAVSTYRPTTLSFISTSGSCTHSTAFPQITTLSASNALSSSSLFEKLQNEETRPTGYIIPLVVCLIVLFVLSVVFLLVLCKKRRKSVSYGPNVTESSSGENIECATY